MNKKSLVILISVIALLIVECIAFVCIKFSNDDNSDLHVHRYVYSQTKTQTCNWDGEQKGECICGDTVVTVLPKLEHVFKDGVCKLCNKKRVDLCEHNWNEATCESAKNCAICGLNEGEELNHLFADNSCERCGLTATDNYYFTFTLLNNGTYSVKLRKGINLPEKIVIPNSYEGNPVTDVDFKGGFSNLTSVIVPNSITKINASAFANCKNLTFVILPNGLEEIANNAFDGCSSLTSIKIPKTVTSIGSFAFNSCINLTSIVIPNSVTYMGPSVFQNCTNLLSAKISDQLTEIPNSTFYLCTSLASIEIPDNVTTINRDAFQSCKNLKSIVIGKNLQFVNYFAFGGCKNLSDIYIKDLTAWLNLQAVDYNHDKNTNCVIFNSEVTRRLYLNNELITKLVIPQGVTFISAMAFQNCENITEVIIPNSVIEIKARAFYLCSNLKSVSIENPDVEFWVDAFTLCPIENAAIPGKFLSSVDKTNLKNLTILDGSIPDTMFLGCSKLTTVVIKSGVKSIGERAFAACANLTTIIIEKGALRGIIGSRAFFNCPNLTIKYTGSQAEWDAILKRDSWNQGFTNNVIFNYS